MIADTKRPYVQHMTLSIFISFQETVVFVFFLVTKESIGRYSALRVEDGVFDIRILFMQLLEQKADLNSDNLGIEVFSYRLSGKKIGGKAPMAPIDNEQDCDGSVFVLRPYFYFYK